MNTLRPIAAIALLSLFAVSSAAIGAPSDGATSRPGEDKASAIVQLKGDPLATSAKTKPPQGKKIDFDSAAVKSYRANLSALRNDFKAWLRTNAPRFGFHLSYPRNNPHGIGYEPWHWCWRRG